MATAPGEAGREGADERLVADFLAAFVGGDASAMDDLVTDDCVLHQPRWPKDTVGRDAIRAATTTNEGTFADVVIRVEDSITDGDRIAVFAVASGRNVGPLRMEDREIAPTGRTFEVPQFGHYRLEDGRVAEAWVLADALGLVEQLGNLPRGPGAMARIAVRQLRWRLGGKRSLE